MDQRRTHSFLDTLNAKLTQYQLEKAIRLDKQEPKNKELHQREIQAKQTLI